MENDSNSVLLNQHGAELFNKGDLTGARDAFIKALENNPDYPDALNNLAVTLWKLGEHESAVSHISHAVSLAPDNRAVVITFSQICLNVGCAAHAARILSQYLDLYPEDAEIREYLQLIEVPPAPPELPSSPIRQKTAESGMIEILRALGGRTKIGRLYDLHALGNMAVGTDIFLRRRQLGEIDKDTKHVFVCGENPANRQLLDMFKRKIPIIENQALVDLYDGSTEFRNSEFYYPTLDTHSREFREFHNADASLEFTPDEEMRGQQELLRMGIPAGSWFACLFVRDGAYKKFMHGCDWNSDNIMRNADIDTFGKAIDYIVEKGGYVVRIGHKVSKPLQHPSPRVIDYATHFRSDFMDIYLAGKCRFLVGMPSGICDVFTVFDRPIVHVNYTPLGGAPWGKNQIYIPKRLKRRDSGEYADFRSMLHQLKDSTQLTFDGCMQHDLGYVYEDNSEDEILEAVKEILDRLDGTFVETDEDRRLFREYRALFPEDHWAFNCATPVGRDFLRKNQAYFFPQRIPAPVPL